MMRRSKREIERALDVVAGPSGDEDVVVVQEDPVTGDWLDGIGEDAAPVSDDVLEAADRVFVVRNEVVETEEVR